MCNDPKIRCKSLDHHTLLGVKGSPSLNSGGKYLCMWLTINERFRTEIIHDLLYKLRHFKYIPR